MPNKHVSFHIGVHAYDPTVYQAKDLLSASDDARAMYNLADRLGFTPLDLKPRGQWDGTQPKTPPNVKIDQAAKYDDVVKLFNDAAALLKDEGDRCFITFSGHGTQFEKDLPTNGDGKFNEAVCVFDFPLIDDVIVGLLGAFNKGVDVFLMLDCCHAGPTSDKKVGHLLEGNKVALLPLGAPPKQSSKFGIPKVAPKPTAPPPLRATQLFAEFKGFDRSTLTANVAAFLACRDTENTFDGKNPGDLSIFTRKFLDAVGDGTKSIRAVGQAVELPDPAITVCHPRFQHSEDETFLDRLMKKS
jgi:hypothetical protein